MSETPERKVLKNTLKKAEGKDNKLRERAT